MEKSFKFQDTMKARPARINNLGEEGAWQAE
jgi:hypothetical protein